MIFAINEAGDIDLDYENNTICNQINGDLPLSSYKKARTIVLTHFKHYNVLRDNFIKNKRNIFTDEEIKKYLNKELEKAFYLDINLLNFVKFQFINTGKKLDIIFYYFSKEIKKNLLVTTVEI